MLFRSGFPRGSTDEERAAIYAAEKLKNSQINIIPVTKTDATQNKVFAFKDNKGNEIKGSFQNFVDIDGKLYTQISESNLDEKGKPDGTTKTTLLPLNAHNLSTVNNEYSDKKSGHNVLDALNEFGYGDQIKGFNVQISGGAQPAAQGGEIGRAHV